MGDGADKVALFWFRRDLRLEDNHGLLKALQSGTPVLTLFIFDTDIIDALPQNDHRVQFIYQNLKSINAQLQAFSSSLLIKKGRPVEVFKDLLKTYSIASVYTNRDYEPYAQKRDQEVNELLQAHGARLHSFKDHVILEKNQVVKDNGEPYVVFTPYKRRWLNQLQTSDLQSVDSVSELHNLFKEHIPFPDYESLDFLPATIVIPPINLSQVAEYDQRRDNPAADETTRLGPHLRFGTVSIRQIARLGQAKNETFLSELIWREFYSQILFHFPHVVNESFRREYDQIAWRNDESDFERWCEGKTGYPLVDAGMRQLNESGFMHNRVRMLTASFLVKHLLIDWRWGEAYFAEKLSDYDLASNNGGWQWAAGCGTDAAPYFRVFNPTTQYQKFDPKSVYVKRWLREDFGRYPPMVDHKVARQRALDTYKAALAK